MDLMLSANKNPVNDVDDDDITEDEDSGDNYLLVSSSGPAGDKWGHQLGLFRKSEDTIEGRSVYIKGYETHNRRSILRLFSDQGVWKISFARLDDLVWNISGFVILRASTPSVSPTSVTWQYAKKCAIPYKKTWLWHDDPAITVTNLSEKPSECEITISLTEDMKRDIQERWVEGVYRADGSYCQGRPVLKRQGGRITLSVSGSACWRVSDEYGFICYLESGSAPSQCPADPRAARSERRGMTYWKYWSKLIGLGMGSCSNGIIVKCNKHTHRSTEDEASSDHKYILVSSSGPAAENCVNLIGLYKKTTYMRDGRSVYDKEHDAQYACAEYDYPFSLFSDKGVWRIKMCLSYEHKYLRAATPSVGPTSVPWQYKDFDYENNKVTWVDDPALTVTSLSEKPSCNCEITISLSKKIRNKINEPRIAGVYKADGSYYMGRPVFKHSRGRYTLHVSGGSWSVSFGVGGGFLKDYLISSSAPSNCPADPKAARSEKNAGSTHWRMAHNKNGICSSEFSEIIVKCNKHTH